MIRLANVLVAVSDRSAAEILIGKLGRNGYHAVQASTADAALADAQAEIPDLVVVADDIGDPVKLGAELKFRAVTADIPVVVLAGTVSPELCLRALDAGLDDVIDFAANDAELFARLRPLVRLATMHAELGHRAAAARRLGVEPRELARGSHDGLPAVLVVGEDQDGVAAGLEAEADITVSGDLFEAEDLLTRKDFKAVVLAVPSVTDATLAFCAQVRNNPRLFNLPLVLISDGTSSTEAFRRGASRVLTGPTEPRLLRCIVLGLVRRQQLRWGIRSVLADTLAEPTRDPVVPNVYNRAFLEAYLADRLAQALTHRRHLAVVSFSIPNIEGVRRQFGDDAARHLSQQLGQWIGGLLRAEDLTAIIRKDEFSVVLPDTPLFEAEVVMHRIAGVLAYTDFAVRDVYQPVKVWVQVGCTDITPGDDVAGLLARARSNLD